MRIFAIITFQLNFNFQRGINDYFQKLINIQHIEKRSYVTYNDQINMQTFFFVFSYYIFFLLIGFYSTERVLRQI